MEDFFFHFYKKLVTSGYLKTGYLTGYLRVEVTRGHQKKKPCPPRGGGLDETKTRPIFSKNAKYCPNPIIIINKVVEDVPGDVRDVSKHISDDLL